METFNRFDDCIAKAHEDRFSRSDVKTFSEKQKADGHVGLYMSEIVLNDGGFLRQLCMAGRHDREVSYTLMGAGPSIKGGTAIHPGLVMPGGLVVLKVENFKTKELCEEGAQQEMQRRGDVSNIDHNTRMKADYTVITLNNGSHLAYVCRVTPDGVAFILASPINGHPL